VGEGPHRPHRLRVARPAARSITDELPEVVAAALVEFITGDYYAPPGVSVSPCGESWRVFGRRVGAAIGCCTSSTTKSKWSQLLRPNTVGTSTGSLSRAAMPSSR